MGLGLLGPLTEERNPDGDGVGWGSGSWVATDGVGDGGGVSSCPSLPEEVLSSKAEAEVLADSWNLRYPGVSSSSLCASVFLGLAMVRSVGEN